MAVEGTTVGKMENYISKNNVISPSTTPFFYPGTSFQTNNQI